MIKEKFGDYFITYNISNYWEIYKPEVVEVWPVSGSLVETNIKTKFIDYVLGR